MLRNIIDTGFAAWMQKPIGSFPLAVIPLADAKAIGSTTRIAKMSSETLLKQQKSHPELTATDYASVQDAVDKGKKYTQGTSKIAYALNIGGGVVAIIKATSEGDEIYVVSVWRLSGEDAKRARILEQLQK